MDSGLTMATHLGNGCPLKMHRHDNIIQRVLNLADGLWIGFIADGVHVPWHALKNYLRLAGDDRAFVVTDAIQAAGLGAGEYRLGEQTVIVQDDLSTWSADRSHLVGSAATMPNVAMNLRCQLGLDVDSVDRLTRINPTRALREAPLPT
jgi:N-acetylglucosamine-6-phosphate deacetylase